MTQATKTRWQDLILWDGTSEIGITLEYGDDGFEEIVRRYRDTGEIHGYWFVDPRDYEDDDYDGLDSGPTPDEIDWEGLDEITLDIDVSAWMNDDGGDCVEVEGLGTVAIRPMTAAEIDSCQKKGKGWIQRVRLWRRPSPAQ
jgi:hypothetical protein